MTESLRLGVPEAEKPTFSITYETVLCPVVVPVKRRRLTGKAYRIARRRYHRKMKAYRRGEIPPTLIRTHVPKVALLDSVQVPGSNSPSLRFGVIR